MKRKPAAPGVDFFRGWKLRSLAIIFFVAIGFVAMQSVAEDMTFGRLVYWGKSVERHRRSSAPVEKLLSLAAAKDAYGLCRTDILRPILSLHLLRLGQLNRVNDFSTWSGEVEETQKFLRHMARCSPYDANIWTRYALISQSVAEDPANISGLLKTSHALAPNEYGQVMARIQVLRNASSATLALSEPVLVHDLYSALQYGNPDLIKLAASGRTKYYQQAYVEQRSRLTPERDKAFKKKKLEYKPAPVLID